MRIIFIKDLIMQVELTDEEISDLSYLLKEKYESLIISLAGEIRYGVGKKQLDLEKVKETTQKIDTLISKIEECEKKFRSIEKV